MITLHSVATLTDSILQMWIAMMAATVVYFDATKLNSWNTLFMLQNNLQQQPTQCLTRWCVVLKQMSQVQHICSMDLCCLLAVTHWETGLIQMNQRAAFFSFKANVGLNTALVCLVSLNGSLQGRNHYIQTLIWLQSNYLKITHLSALKLWDVFRQLKQGQDALVFHSICGFWVHMCWALNLHIQLKLGTCSLLIWVVEESTWVPLYLLSYTQDNSSHLPVFYILFVATLHHSSSDPV